MSKKSVSPLRPPTRPPPRDGRPRNRLLAGLPLDEFRRILPRLTTVPLNARTVLLKRGEPIRYVYFPNGGVCSVTTMMKNGMAVEVATVGNEGVLGVSSLFSRNGLPGDCMVQVPNGSAERMTVEAFCREMDLHGALHKAVNRYSHGFLTLMMQSTACMALHHVNERCCRWLLMTHDRIGADEFTLSQEFLAMMLGAARPTVSIVASSLQEAGLISYTHARMRILDRRGLETASCECYETVKTAFDRLKL
jgi:CRP-like cAMP-binding protein